jgi:hypothetical protein
MTLWLVLSLVVWLVSGVLAGGLSFAFFQGYFPELADAHYARDRRMFIGTIIGGPCALAGTLLFLCDKNNGFKYGWRWK